MSLSEGSAENIVRVYERASASELYEGKLYYPRQRERCEGRAIAARLPIPLVIGAFAALSPNNTEAATWRALDVCIRITLGFMTADSRVSAYPLNKDKALRILDGGAPESILKEQKVRSFYFNTIDPLTSEEVTVDGHAYGIWTGTPLKMKAVPLGSQALYKRIAGDYRRAAFLMSKPCTEVQATVWLAWKRIHRIAWNPQISLEF